MKKSLAILLIASLMNMCSSSSSEGNHDIYLKKCLDFIGRMEEHSNIFKKEKILKYHTIKEGSIDAPEIARKKADTMFSSIDGFLKRGAFILEKCVDIKIPGSLVSVKDCRDALNIMVKDITNSQRLFLKEKEHLKMYPKSVEEQRKCNLSWIDTISSFMNLALVVKDVCSENIK